MIVKTIFNLTMLGDESLDEAKDKCIANVAQLSVALSNMQTNGFSISNYENNFGSKISINPKNVVYEEALPTRTNNVDLARMLEYNRVPAVLEGEENRAEVAWSVIRTICFKVIKVGEHEYYCYSLTDKEI